MNPDKMRGSKEGIREIQSPLGDGNVNAVYYEYGNFWERLEKYSPR